MLVTVMSVSSDVVVSERRRGASRRRCYFGWVVVLADELRGTRVMGPVERVSSAEGLVVGEVCNREPSDSPECAEAPRRIAVVWVVIRHAGR
jgi:hypothetical protein